MSGGEEGEGSRPAVSPGRIVHTANRQSLCCIQRFGELLYPPAGRLLALTHYLALRCYDVHCCIEYNMYRSYPRIPLILSLRHV